MSQTPQSASPLLPPYKFGDMITVDLTKLCAQQSNQLGWIKFTLSPSSKNHMLIYVGNDAQNLCSLWVPVTTGKNRKFCSNRLDKTYVPTLQRPSSVRFQEVWAIPHTLMNAFGPHPTQQPADANYVQGTIIPWCQAAINRL